MSPGRIIYDHLSDTSDTSDNANTDSDYSLIEPVAVIGFSLKFPQDATSPEGFWEMMAGKRSAMTEFPADRLNIDAFYHPSRRDALPIRGGHFIKEDMSAFDADFFSITPSEAAAMDPAQRLLLETAFRAFENAGIRLEDLKGSDTSVHTGCFTNDYLHQMLKDPEQLPTYAAIGATLSMLANRLSWFYDLRGPSVNLDSACSSSAMAIDQACQLLRQGECGIGLVGGCNLTFDPDYANVLTNMQFLSPDSRCYAFDHRANGYSRGEGFGVVILKLLPDAIRDNDTIRAVIRASGSNQDGRTPGITQPNAKAQTQLMVDTYRRAGLTMRHTRFFEAHGTGTAIGDPAEAGAIVDAFRSHRSSSDPLYIGAVKTNIGHLEGASGIASLIKTILILETGVIVPNANFEQANRKLDVKNSCIAFPTACVAWPKAEIRRASINSFGYGGSNCHIVVDDAFSYLSHRGLRGNHRTIHGKPGVRLQHAFANVSHSQVGKAIAKREDNPFKTPQLLVWSASHESSLQQAVLQWQEYCSKVLSSTSQDASIIQDIAYTLDSRRTSLQWKSYTVVSSKAEMANFGNHMSKPIARKGNPRLSFVFTGQGAQWFAMGRELLRYTSFARTVVDADAYLASLGCSWSVEEELLRPEHESRIDFPDLAQPLTAILQVGLVDLMKSFGVEPVAVVGHSMGEIAAAYCAGAFSRESAFKLAYYRGLYVATIPDRDSMKGGMLAVGLSAEDIISYFERIRPDYPGFNLMVSCINSPVNITVSGEESQLEALKLILHGDSIFARRLRVSAAYHSPQMEQIATDCLNAFGTLKIQDPSSSIAMISTVTGLTVSKEQLCQASYWVQNMISPVLFLQAIQSLCSQSKKSLKKKIDGRHRNAIVVDHVIEIGPHAALKGPIRDSIAALPRRREVNYSSALYRTISATKSVLELCGQLHCVGVPVNLRQVNGPDVYTLESRVCLADLPEYPFNHATKYWFESPLSRNYRLRSHGYTELLGNRARDWNPLDPQWRHCVRVSEMPWLEDHKMSGKILYPASAMCVMAIEAASQLVNQKRSISSYALRYVQFLSALPVPSGFQDMETRVRLKPLRTRSAPEQSSWEFTIFSVADGNWTKNCSGLVQVNSQKQSVIDDQKLSNYWQAWASDSSDCIQTVDSIKLYRSWRKQGFQYGPSFQGIKAARHNGRDKATASIELSKTLETSQNVQEFTIHPAMLDSIMQLALVALTKGATREILTQVVTSIDKIWISNEALSASNHSLNASAIIDSQCPRTTISSIFALDDQQRARVVLNGLETSAVTSSLAGLDSALQSNQYWYNVHTAVDLDMLTPGKTMEWLECVCGPDIIGPISFGLDLNTYILSVLSSVQHEVRSTGLVPSKPHLRRYLQWIDWQLEKSNDSRPLTVSDESLVTRIQSQGSVGLFFTQVADHALGVLRGEVDVVQLLFESNLAKQFYEEQSFGSNYYCKFEKYMETFAFKHPTMNILEVGAGTGLFTKHTLNALSAHNSDQEGRYNQYFYTDVSPSFFERAKDEFSAQARKMIFKTLDIGADPLAQGFEQASFDIVLASNVLHAGKNLGTTLRAVRKLLKPGAKLILQENTCPDKIETGFAFGLLPGWWYATEENRTTSPTVNEATWDHLLTSNGFSGVDFTLRDYSDDSCHLMSIMCATAVEVQQLETPSKDIAIVIEQGSELQMGLAHQLEARLLTETGDVARVVSLTDAATLGTLTTLCVSLLDVETPILPRLTEDGYSALRCFMLSAGHVLWITRSGESREDPGFGMIDGFTKVLRIEHIQLKISTLALEDVIQPYECHVRKIIQVIGQFNGSSSASNVEDYVVVDGTLNVKRISKSRELSSAMLETLSGKRTAIQTLEEAQPVAVSFQRPGQLDSLEIIKDTTKSGPLQHDEAEIAVHTIGLNALDFEVAVGRTSSTALGSECAGVVKAVGSGSTLCPGDRVCVYGSDLFKSVVRVKTHFVARIPEIISFAEASILPQEYLFASYLLHNIVRLTSRDTVLIHGGQNSISKALINLALEICSFIFVTVPTEEDEKVYRGIHLPDRVRILPHTSFSEALYCMTGRGADVVLNMSLEPDFLDLLDSTSPFGQIVHVEPLGKEASEGKLMINIPSNISFKVVDMGTVLRERIDLAEKPLQSLLNTAIPAIARQMCAQGLHTFTLSQIDRALASLREIGSLERVTIEFDKKELISVVQELKPRYFFDPVSTYVISGGLGSLGRCIVTWMASRGARNLVILSRSGPRTEAARQLLKHLENTGLRIWAPCCDISNRATLGQRLIECSKSMPPIRGCIQTSAALKDVLYQNMSWEDWQIAIDPKVKGSWNLHSLLPHGMDFFIMTSSITGITGQATQINYAAANTYQDALARHRVAHGEKAVSLDLGLLLTGGLLAQSPDLLERFTSTGLYTPVSEPEILALFDHFCDPELKMQSVSQAQVIVGIKSPADVSAQGYDLLEAMRQPLWSQTHPTVGRAAGDIHSVEDEITVCALLRKEESVMEAGTLVTDALAKRFSRMLSIPEGNLNFEEPLHANGADSLSAVDLRNWVMKTFAVDVSVFDILGDASMAAIGRMIALRWLEAQGQT